MEHWSRLAQMWNHIGPPLRPTPEDIRVTRAALDAHAEGRPVEVLVLGVTPELVGMPLPDGSSLVAVDRDPGMIEALFVPAPGRRVLVGDWRELPFPSASIDVIVGDGCATLFAYPEGYRTFAAELARVLKPGGIVVLRFFVAPEIRESLEAVGAAMATIQSFDALRWRIAMAVQPPTRGVAVTAIREAFEALVPDRTVLTSRGWRPEAIALIDQYRDSPAVYSFPTFDEARACFAPWFDEIRTHIGSYELADRCPTLVLRRAATGG